MPLSFTLDSFGPLARTVECCAVLDAVLADEPVRPVQPRTVKGMRLAVPTTVALDDLDDHVARSFERTLEKLSRQGASIERIEVWVVLTRLCRYIARRYCPRHKIQNDKFCIG